MGHAIPRQQPAVVLRSNFNKLRALLAIALVAVAGLTVAVVILANDSDQVGSTSAASASEDGTPSFARPGSETEFRGSMASEDGRPSFARPGSETDLPGRASALP
jgi:hypothetical protein